MSGDAPKRPAEPGNDELLGSRLATEEERVDAELEAKREEDARTAAVEVEADDPG